MKQLFSAITTLLVLLVMTSAQKDVESNPADTITRTELKDHVYFLASDEMRGRVIYTEDFKVAAQYCAGQFRQAGLAPIIKTDEYQDYLYEVPFVKKSTTMTSPFTVRKDSSTYRFDAAVETRYLFQSDISVFSKGKPIVFAGYGISAPEQGWDDFDGLEIDGKIIVVLPGAPIHKRKPVLPHDIHEKLESTNPILRWLRKYQLLKALDAQPAAIVIISDKIIDKKWNNLGGNNQSFKVFLAEDADSPQSELDLMLISRSVAEVLFEDQIYNPVSSDRVDLDEYQTFELKDVDLTLEVGCELEEFCSWNVMGMVQGRDPLLSDEYIVIGGHLDHVPPVGGQINNGADDNASGCAGVLEVAEALAMSVPPKRSVLFCLWTGEEPLRGDACMGSKFFIHNPPIPLEKIKTYINLDMIGRSGPENEKDRAHIVGSTREMMPAVEALVNSINEQNVNWPLVYEEITSSDHMNFLDAGIPAFMFYSGLHKDVHTPNDDPEKIDYEKMEKLSRLVYWITIELANDTKALEKQR